MNDDVQESLVVRLRKRASIRRQVPTRKSVQQNKPDIVSDLLEEAAARIELLEEWLKQRTNELMKEVENNGC